MSRNPTDSPDELDGNSDYSEPQIVLTSSPDSTSGIDYHEIAPIDLDFSALDSVQASDNPVASSSEERGRPSWMVPALAALLLLALAVVFLLPRVVQAPQTSVDVNDQLVEAPKRISDEASPWQEAQVAKQRSAAQQALEPLLDKQFDLEELQVELWAADQFQELVALAEEGDGYYRKREFIKATETFEKALEIADTLLNSVAQRTLDSLQAGLQAIDNFDAQAAKQAFTMALVFDSDNEDARAGLARLPVLDEVKTALEAAQSLEEQGQFSAAKAQLEKALALDSVRANILSPRIDTLSDRIRDENFARLMSEGYRNLDSGRRQAAINSFTEAARLKPNESQPGVAIKQVRNEQALNAMARHFEKAESSEATEQWSAAVAAYNAALKIDGNLGDASKRLAYAKQRTKMDVALETLKNDPLRLADAEIYQKALKIVAAGRNISSPGPRLSEQLATLEQYLTASRESKPVTISSDGITQVSLPRVARLGAIQQRQLNLKPGRYAAVGIREGFRDVRKEFVVPLGSSSVEVDVRCVEPI
ncbi:MAG: hypothetical protein AAF542_12365 [Pseudomonadota bacterium]